ncbi:bifunctional metallophosphatase/5'-nucleotidase [Paenibacillus sp. KN14-4R]|uniref:bifunctional metallophosphatase/5'-nucleotidase n=1 Tax=Paenibacillus sp. KN14-4R TaxID=3445773 RepID=UPI003F9EF669
MTETNTNTSFTLTILETSDLHGTILPIQYANNTPKEVGLAKVATLIHVERQLNPHTLLIDNGDLIQGTPLAYYHARVDHKSIDPMVLCLNELKYDAAVIGNHEFNYGLDVLGKAVSESNFPWLSANTICIKEETPYFGPPYVIKQFDGGPRVGILGITTPFIPNWENPKHIEGLAFDDAVETASKWVKHLREWEKVDVVVVSYHGGFERDIQNGEVSEPETGENQGYRICTEVPGIDVLLTGHQHRTIAGEMINGVVVVQPGTQGTFLAKVQLQLELRDQAWVVVQKQSELLPVEGVPADPRLMELVQDYEDKTQVWLDQPIGKLIGDMRVSDPMMIRLKSSSLIELIHQIQMEFGQTDISSTALFDNDAPGFSSNITMREVVANYIYPNTLKVIRVTGQDVLDALEHSAAYFAPYTGDGIRVSDAFLYPKPQHYNYDMWAGIDYEINISRAVGERVTKLEYKGKPIDLNGHYDVVMNNYRASGGGNYTMFQGKPVIRDIPTDVSELIVSYMMERGTVEAKVNPNWQVVYEK